MTGFNRGLNPGLNRVGQNLKNPDTVGKTIQVETETDSALNRCMKHNMDNLLNDYDIGQSHNHSNYTFSNVVPVIV